jgi:adiponectin receptor
MTVGFSGIKGWRDELVMTCFFIGAIGCLTLSTLFHLFCCHSRHVSSMWNKADYIGIVVLITGSFVPLVYYGFYCYPVHQAVYVSMILLFGAATISISVSSFFATPQYRFLRTGLFTAMGLSGIVPLVNGVLIYGYPLAKVNFAIERVIFMGSLYLIGAFIYAFRVPERWWPGKFDIIGQSHQIFHILVVAGAAIHYTGVQLMQSWWLENNPQCQLNTSELKEMFHY